MFPATNTRVQQHTPTAINERIQEETQRRVANYLAAGNRTIDQRLNELDQEWDIERVLETNAATVSLIGLGLGKLVDRRFNWLPVAVAGFLLQHAVQGWCPPLPVFRRLGFRTQSEIEQERYALKALRGDFKGLGTSRTRTVSGVEEVLEAVQR